MGSTYDPRTHVSPCYTAGAAAFLDKKDSPRAFLERCLETIDRVEPVVRGWVHLNVAGARAAADDSARRWAQGRPLSAIDGLPLGVKDLIETIDMPTESGCRGLSGNFPKRDNAGIWALRQAGAIILGKTVTTEFGGPTPGPTTNPFDAAHTPGGSSSGSAAVVGASMVPVAIGSQTGGSMIRPASFCANYALKPSQGAINRGERQVPSISTHGPQAGTLEDMWAVAIEMATRAGGDPGHAALFGPRSLPRAHRPMRLAIMETDGMATMSEAARAAFENVLAQVKDAGVEIVSRADDPKLEEFERLLQGVSEVNFDILAWELQWTLRNVVLANPDPDAISPGGKAIIQRGEQVGVAGYERALRRREELRSVFMALDKRFDAFIAPSSKGSAPRADAGMSTSLSATIPTGDPVFNTPSSILGACTVTLPITSVDRLPMGIQLMGQLGSDARITAFSAWMREATVPAVF